MTHEHIESLNEHYRQLDREEELAEQARRLHEAAYGSTQNDDHESEDE